MKKILLTTAAVLTVASVNAKFYVGVDVAGQALNTKLSDGKAAGDTLFFGVSGGANPATEARATAAAGVTDAATMIAATVTGSPLTKNLENAQLDPNGDKWHHNYRFGAQAGWSMAMEGGFWGALDLNAHFGGANKELIANKDAKSGTATATGVATAANDSTAHNIKLVYATGRKAMKLSNKFNVGLGVKLGYKAGNAVPYIYVGGDYGQFKINDDTAASSSDYTTKTKNKFGFAAGVGVIGHINEMVSVEVAYRYADHGSFKYTYKGNVPVAIGAGVDSNTTATAAQDAYAVGASNGTGSSNVGTTITTGTTQAIGEVKHKLRSHTATIGFNVHFG